MMVRLSRLGLTLWVAALSGWGNGGSSDKGSSSAGSGGTTGGTAASGGALSGSGGSAGAAGTGAGAGGKAGMAGSAGNGGAGGLPTSEKPFDWVGVIGTGQSLSVGWESTAISTTQPFKNVTLLDEGPDPKYPIDSSGSPSWSTVPLIEPIRIAVAGTGAGYDDWQYPNNIAHNGETYGETPHSGMANTLSALWQARGGEGDYITAHSVVGWSGHGIVDIDKTGGKRAYLASLAEANVFNALAAAEGKTYGVGGIVLTHGENDANNPVYGAALYQLWQDYNADLKAITGQAQDVILFGSQQSSSAPGYDSSAVQLWRAGVDHPGQIVCTGPKYQYRPYGLHLPGPGYERLGEKYGEVFDLIVNQKVAWKPLGPNHVARSGAVITIDFDVPNPPLQWDERLAAPHQAAHTAWANGKGFEVLDGSMAELSIASVEIQDNSVILTLSAAPAADAQLTLGYALTQDTTDGFQGGTDLGPHGQLRDSDEFVGYDVETIQVQVSSGSPDIVAPSGGFSRRTGRDVVSGGDLPADTAFVDLLWDSATLSSPWTGATGTAMLTFHHDHHNYCVHFAMDVL